jgi:hypothetical protein
MRASWNDKNLCNDKWLTGLVDALDEVQAQRADDICRGASVPAGLLAQLYGQMPKVRRPACPSRSRFELA